jgi:hypothetical protein
VPLPDEKSHLSSNLKIRTWPLTDGYHKNSCMLPKLIGLILKTSCHSSENDFFPSESCEQNNFCSPVLLS